MLPSSGIYITDDDKNEIRSDFSDSANVIVAGVDTESMYDIYLEDSIFSPSDGAFINSQILSTVGSSLFSFIYFSFSNVI